jgi:GDP-mannose 6-dehydrogenase
VALGAVDAVVTAIGRAIRDKPGPHTVVMRSTVPPGTAEDRVIPLLERESGRALGQRLHYYSNPEFLREGSSVRDFRSPPFTLIGAPAGDDATILRQVYAPIQAAVHLAPFRVAESVKHISNVFHAVKLAFANEAGAILASYGVDAREAFRLLCEDKVLNVSAAYLKPGFAFGGSCLPKDVRSFLSLADARNLSAPFLKQLLPSNQAIIDRAYEAITRHGRQPISLFGLSFKQGTDDLRESPFVRLAERLIGRGYDLRIYDRFVQVARLMGANRSFIEKEIPHLERLMVISPEAALSTSRVAVIGHIAPEDRPALLAGLSGHIVIDLAGMDALRDVPGITYEGLCW